MIWTIDKKEEKKLLQKKLAPFNFNKYSKQEIRDLIKKMREAMKNAHGIGLSANQIGLDARVFVAQPGKKLYAIFNPEIVKLSDEKILMEEGCLSVPEVFGSVERPDKLTIVGYDMNNKKIKIKAWGLLARVFLHEMDHLNGYVFIEKAKDLHKYVPETKENK